MESGDISSSAMYEDNREGNDIYPIYPSKDEEVAVKTAVTKDCIYAFAYFRAVLLKNEKSTRVVRLLEDCIRLNPANPSGNTDEYLLILPSTPVFQRMLDI
uniref:TPR_REGION domain-containing protein n=1 Tax=Caenorhabditis tropicalis TaxID=1561998 RepID=A0A1I7TFC9_9PELO